MEVRPQLSTVKECVGGEDDDMEDSDEDVRTEFGGSRSGVTSRVLSVSGKEVLSALSGGETSRTLSELISPLSPLSGEERAASGDIEKMGMVMTRVESFLEGHVGQTQATDGSTNALNITGTESGQDALTGGESQSSPVCSTETSVPVLLPAYTEQTNSTPTSHHANGSIDVGMESSTSLTMSRPQADKDSQSLSDIPPTLPGIASTHNAAVISEMSVDTLPSTVVTPPDLQSAADSATRRSMEGLVANTGSSTGTAEFRTGSSRVLRLCNPGDDTYRPHSRSASFSELLVERGGSGGMASRGGMSMLSTASTGSPFTIVSTSTAEEGAYSLPGEGGIRGSLTGSVASFPATENYIGVVDLENRDDNKSRCLVFRLRVPFENTFKEVEFEFDLEVDDPQTVVEEMNEVEELMFVKEYSDQIVQSIAPVVEVARRVASENANCSSESGSTTQPPLSDLVIEKLMANHSHVLGERALTVPNNAAEESSKVIQNITIEASACSGQHPPVAAHTASFRHGQSDASGLHTREWMERQSEGNHSAKLRSMSESTIAWSLGRLLQVHGVKC